MLKKRSTKLMCLLIAFVWMTIVIGSSYAYYIQNVDVANNVVAMGDLQAELYWRNPGETNWHDASKGAIFNHRNWEPGYSDVKYLNVRNTGDLAFQYELNVFPAELLTGRANLLDVIDVYYGVNVENVTRENYAIKLTRVGTMTELLTNEHGAGSGILLPENSNEDVASAARGSVEACMVLHMQETAGNEYQGLSVGDGFTVQLAAAHYMSQTDSFGTRFDQQANDALPVLNIPTSMITDVTPVNGLVPYDVHFSNPVNGVSATVPAGAKMADGATSLKLVVERKQNSDAKVNLTAYEELFAYNVKVIGLAADNTVPVIINMGEVLPNGLNLGNYDLYHVENGVTVKMTLVDSADLDAHNEFTYDPVNGAVSVAMATFSEVALVADTENAWNGTIATTFSGGTGTEADPYIIANADQLAYMGDRVSNDNENYGSAYYKLISDINIGGVENYNDNGRKVLFYPIGYNKVGGTTADKGNWYTYGGSFMGVFDGNGHKVTGIYQNTWAMVGDYSGTYYNDAMGLFGYVNGGTVKNLTIDKFYSEGEFAPTGCVTAYAAGKVTFENIAITNSHPQTYNTGVAGIVGWDEGDNSDFTFKNITVDSTNTVSALWGSWDVAAAGLLGYLSPNSTANLDNCHVAATIDVYNDVCGNYQYYWYRYCGAFIGTVDKRLDNGKGALDLSNVTAKNCTVNFGNRHEYYYCEFEKNTQASYTDDYQFSRVDHEELNMDANPVTCKHTHTANEDKQAVYIPFHQLFGGYGWGVDGVDLGEYENIEISVVDGSTKKFTGKISDGAVYHVGDTVKVGDLFAEISDVTPEINKNNVQVFVSPVGEDSTAGGTYTANTTNWTQGTLTFFGTGAATITITDYYFCTETKINVTINDKEPVEKFDVVMNNGDFLHRVGNSGTVALDKLFKAKDSAEIGTVDVTVEAVDGMVASGTYSNNAIQFSGTGVVKVTITDNDYCTPTVLYLEVVDAKNATTATDATATANNVVLLNDISGGFTVSKGYAFYGNGFKATCAGDGSYRSAAVSYGFVTVENGGVLDNVQIICDIFPESYLYTTEMKAGSDARYPYGYSAVVISGNSTISNSYIYGARNNIQIGEGNVTVKNTVMECGSLSNIHIKSNDSHTVTLDNVTTIQYQTTSKYDTSKKVLGFGILVGTNESTSNPTVKILGDLKQYNWVTNADTSVSNTYAKTAITEALKVSAYQHTINNTTTVNMGIVHLNNLPTAITDERTNKTGIPYKLNSISISGQTGQVYSISGSSITADSRYDAKTDGILPYNPTQNREIYPDVIYSLPNSAITATNGYDSNKARWQSKLTVDLDNITGGSYAFMFSNLTVQKYDGVELAFTIKGSDGNTVDKSTAITLDQLYNADYTLIVTDNHIYDANGNLSGKTSTVEIPFVISAIKTSIDPPKFTNEGTATAIRLVSSKGGDWRPAYTVLTGVSVTYWSASDSKVKTVDLSTLYNSGTISSNVWTYTCNDYTLTITGGAVHSDGTTITPVVANDTLYFASTNKAFGTGTTSRNIILTYVFTDKNDSTTWNRTETVTYSDLSEYDYDSFKNDGELTEPSSCVTPDTLFTMADGTQTRADALAVGDMVMVFNHITGQYEAAPIIFNNHAEDNAEKEYDVLHLQFANGKEVKIIASHGFYDMTLMQYVYITYDNYQDYIGHEFYSLNSEGSAGERVKLVKAFVETERTRIFCPVSYFHMNSFANGFLNTPNIPGDITGLVNYFEYDDDIKYNEEAMQRDIDTYGVYTYDDFRDYISEAAFHSSPSVHLKVAVGKGMLTFEQILDVIEYLLAGSLIK